MKIINKHVIMERRLTALVQQETGDTSLEVWHRDGEDYYQLSRSDSDGRITWLANLGPHSLGEKRLAEAVIAAAKKVAVPSTIPPRFLAGSTEPAVAGTVEELRELLAELPGTMPIVGGSMLSVAEFYKLDWLSIRYAPDEDEPLADPDGDFDPDESCAVCGKPAVRDYPLDESGEPSCGSAACELRMQAASDYHNEAGDR